MLREQHGRAVDQVLDVVAVQLQDQRLPGGEVAVERPDADARLLGDRGEGRAAGRGYRLSGDGQDALPVVEGVAAGRFRGSRVRGRPSGVRRIAKRRALRYVGGSTGGASVSFFILAHPDPTPQGAPSCPNSSWSPEAAATSQAGASPNCSAAATTSVPPSAPRARSARSPTPSRPSSTPPDGWASPSPTSRPTRAGTPRSRASTSSCTSPPRSAPPRTTPTR